MADTSETPVIQVLEKENYFNQALVTLPSPAYPPLGPSALRIRTKVLGLSVNNFTYARLGFLANWWNVHPLPAGTPAPYDDPAKYGRLAAWGWAEVLESTHDGVPAGSFLWGYQSIGTLAQDLTVRDAEVPGHIIVTSEYRQNVMQIYNRYFAVTGATADALRKDIDGKSENPAYDALVRVMFETAYLLNRYAFGSSATPPSTLPGAAPWTHEQADIKGATIIAFAPGSKVGLCFAHELRYSRAQDERVRQVIGAASEQSKSFVERTGLYDTVVSTAESPIDVLAQLGVASDEKVLLADFGGRANICAAWAKILQQKYKRLMVLPVGNDVAEVSPADVLAAMQAAAGVTLPNANDLREQAMKQEGEKKYYDELESAWKSFRDVGLKGFKASWGTGMQDVKLGWERLAQGKVKPDEGLVYVV
ncbi:hypothetical protein GGR50DRAFT_686191 [Xylaria sp. CBS 124048]|nr:hypothetical protein GGR50DRAFT_686191 [Xylaria sp. CBS 124048]